MHRAYRGHRVLVPEEEAPPGFSGKSSAWTQFLHHGVRIPVNTSWTIRCTRENENKSHSNEKKKDNWKSCVHRYSKNEKRSLWSSGAEEAAESSKQVCRAPAKQNQLDFVIPYEHTESITKQASKQAGNNTFYDSIEPFVYMSFINKYISSFDISRVKIVSFSNKGNKQCNCRVQMVSRHSCRAPLPL